MLADALRFAVLGESWATLPLLLSNGRVGIGDAGIVSQYAPGRALGR